jgi:hypothetical protein
VIAAILLNTPVDVQCLELNVMSADKSVTIQTQRFSVTPGQPASVSATGLPLGWVLLSEKAYNLACSLVVTTTPVTWYSPSATSVQLLSGVPVSVTIVLRQAGNGAVGVTTNFESAPNTCSGWVCSPWSYGTGDGCNCNCGCWDPDCNGGGGLNGGAGGSADGGGASTDGGAGSGVDAGTSGAACANWQTCVQPGVCQNVACVGWTCPLSWYGMGYCMSGCGCPDPSCSGGVDGGTSDGGALDTGRPDGGGTPGTDGGSDAGSDAGGACSTCAWGHTFESNNGGFTVSGALTSWDWGVPTSSGPYPWQFPSGGHSGTNVWGTNLSGNYRANEDGYLTSRGIDLSPHAGRAVTVSWWEWTVFNASATVEASKDGGSTWNGISVSNNTMGNKTWNRVAVVLDSSYAVSNFQVRFHFRAYSDPNTQSGWYIDDVCVAPGGLGAYQTDFEANNAGYVASGPTSWAWGGVGAYCDGVTCGPSSVHSGTNAWGTNLSGNYGINENGYITSPVVNLSSLAAEPSIDLRWWDWLYSEPSYDIASIEVSTDGGGTWSQVWGPSSGTLGGWQVHDVILSSAFAVPNFRIRFHFTSDAFNSYPGWYVDDVSLQGTTIDACAPAFDSPIPPACECTGTGPGGVPITVSCGQSTCGSDYHTYACTAAGWSGGVQACGADAGAGPGPDASGCQCSGSGPGGVPISVSCGQSACGSDYTTYACGASGWAWTGQSCTAADDAGAGAGAEAGSCQCSGTGPGGAPVTVNCGQSACGSNHFTYSCSASGWSGPGSGC